MALIPYRVIASPNPADERSTQSRPLRRTPPGPAQTVPRMSESAAALQRSWHMAASQPRTDEQQQNLAAETTWSAPLPLTDLWQIGRIGVRTAAPGPAGGRASGARPPSTPQHAPHPVDNGTHITAVATAEKPADPTSVQRRPEEAGTSDEINLQRANNSALQTALQILSAHDFASNADRQCWISEHYRQACSRAPQDSRNHRSAS